MSIMSLLDCLFLLWKRQTTDPMMAMMITIPAATAITMMYVVLSAALLWGTKSEAAGVGPVSDPTVVVEVATPVDGSEVDDTVVLVVEAEDVAAEEVATEEAAEEEETEEDVEAEVPGRKIETSSNANPSLFTAPSLPNATLKNTERPASPLSV